MDTKNIQHGSLKYKLIEAILENPLCKGLIANRCVGSLLRECALYDCYQYVKLLFKYKEKNKLVGYGMRSNEMNHPLYILVEREHASVEWFNLLAQWAQAADMKFKKQFLEWYCLRTLETNKFISQETMSQLTKAIRDYIAQNDASHKQDV